MWLSRALVVLLPGPQLFLWGAHGWVVSVGPSVPSAGNSHIRGKHQQSSSSSQQSEWTPRRIQRPSSLSACPNEGKDGGESRDGVDDARLEAFREVLSRTRPSSGGGSNSAPKRHDWKTFAAAGLACCQLMGGMFGTGYDFGRLRTGPQPAWAAVEEESVADKKAVTGTGAFEEVWDFTDRFALDRKHNGYDWDAVHAKYSKAVADGQDDMEVAKTVVKLLNDKYSRVVSPETYALLSKYDMVGAGVMMSPDNEGKLTVSAPPMGKAIGSGVAKGDRVLGINGKSTADMSAFDVIEFLAKYKGSTISFTLQTGQEDPRTIELERTFQKVNNAVVSELRVTTDGHKVGYMRLKEFNSILADNVKEALEELTAQGADEFVLDLRGNGGGAFQSALSVANIFMENKPITSVVDGEGKRMGFRTKAADVGGLAAIETPPLLVWIDRGSASASEVLAGALTDDCRALLVGQRSFGKGIIQAVYGLSNGGGLILTVARYETPRGTNIQGTGISPDVAAKLPSTWLPGKAPAIDQSWFEQARQKQNQCPPIAEEV